MGPTHGLLTRQKSNNNNGLLRLFEVLNAKVVPSVLREGDPKCLKAVTHIILTH